MQNKLSVIFVVMAVVIIVGIAWLMKSDKRRAAPAKPSEDQKSYSLRVDVERVKGKDGQLVIMLFTQPDGFPSDVSKATHVTYADTENPSCTFHDLKHKGYVVVVFHDRNGNGKVDRNLLGFPMEPVGLSNKPSVTGRPNFEEGRVDVTNRNQITVGLNSLGG